ncbi:MAG: aminotransferase class I/II-fold pyridoxal phosphate-dependent enzyme, partial [Paracoccus sp. (in: a-proteobacteria)]|nr:aminotransferase class I/II-fold pyridoxal phosphate-dependent enzyme [Paracoccus sp. (in: a-proteobacteria)]
MRARCGGGPIAKLASNENAYPPSDAVIVAMRNAIAQAFLYPDPQARHLAEEVSARSGIPAHRIIFGDGSEDLLNILARAILRPRDQVITLYPSFPLHEDYALMMGATVTRIGL